MLLTVFTADAADAPGFAPFETWHYASQIFWLVIFFSILYFVLSRFILPKLGSVIEERESTIADDLDDAARMNEQALEAQKAVEVSIAEAQAKARETASKARTKIDQGIAEATAKVDAELDDKLNEAETRIAQLREETMQNVGDIASEAANSMLARFGTSASKADLGKAVKSALSES